MELLKYFKKTKWLFGWVVALIVINAGFSTLAGISSAKALSAVAKLNANSFFIWVAMMGGAYVMYAIFSYLVTVNQTRLTQSVDTLIRADIAKRLSSTDFKHFHQRTTSTYASWLTNDISNINEFGVGDFMMIIRQISEIIMGAVTLAYFQVSLLVTVVVLAIIMAVVPNLFSKWLSKRSLAVTQANERLVNKINNVLNGFNTLFLANQASVIVSQINSGSADVKKHRVAYSKAAGFTQAITNGIAFLSQVIILAQTGWLILHGLTPVGTISGAQYFAGTIFAELSGISFNWQEFRSLKPVFEKFKKIKLTKSATAAQIDGLKNGITLRDVSYSYPNQDKNVLEQVDFKLESGKKYILVGDSAAGKSTLLNMLSGLIRDYHGQIFYDQFDYLNVSDQALHEKIAYVEQKPYIFADTLRWNLILGRNVEPNKLDEVIKECGIDQIIAKLPAGLDTKLASQGDELSGGQRQRVAFARALLRGTKIFILDEATSSLDKVASAELEQLVLSQSGITVIMVTHHLQDETAKMADQIIQIKNKTIVEKM